MKPLADLHWSRHFLGAVGCWLVLAQVGQAASAGTVVAWGDNTAGRTTVPVGLSGVVGIAAGWSHSLALKSDGTVVAWGGNSYGQSTVPTGLGGVVGIAARYFHSLALKSDGTVVAWGLDDSGQSTVPTGLGGVVGIAAGWHHSLALKSDGTVVVWGNNYTGQNTVPTGLGGVVAIAAGTHLSLALKSDGTVVAWGYNYFGQSTVPAGLGGVVGIAAGVYHSLALKSDGTVVAWGRNDDGESTVPSGLSGVMGVAAGVYHSLALKSDGTVVAWGYNSSGVTDVPSGLRGVVAIAAGSYHSLALVADNPVPPSFTMNPQNQTLAKGANATFSASASGTPPMSFQWLFNNAAIPGATSATLTLNNVQPGNAGRYSLRAVNAVSSAVSSPATLAVQADPANGTPAVPVATPAAPPKDAGQDSLVIITHGWQFGVPSGPIILSDVSWVDDMAATMQQKLATEGANNWRVLPFKWVEAAQWPIPAPALLNATVIGTLLGQRIGAQPWKHVHLIGHSAGAGLVQAASDLIKISSPSTTVHTTFLDPYFGMFLLNRGLYGQGADWSDTYYARDISGPFSRDVPNSHSVDVTNLDPNPQPSLFGLHSWPYQFYLKTVTNGIAASQGYGFPLSMEGGGWANRGNFPIGNSPVVLSGILPVNLPPNARPNAENSKLTVSGAGAVPVLASPTGTVQVNNDVIKLLSGYTLPLPLPPQGLSPASIRQAAGNLVPTSLPVLEPAWVSLGVTVTNLVNYVKFEAGFTSAAGAQGVCSVYWGTNLVGLLDERVASAGLSTYRFQLPETYTNGVFTLGFRLDGYTTTQSSLTLTNVVTGFFGITNPPALTVTGGATNGPAMVTLTGPTNFYSLLQSSTDLTNWSPVATLVNSNGVVQFNDLSATNQVRRFYRAVVP